MDNGWILDVRTLAVVSGLGGWLMGATMLGVYLAGMRERALLIWAAAGLASGFGYLAGHLLHLLPVPIQTWQAAALANALIGLGHGLVLLGVQRYLGKPRWTLLVVLAFLVMLSASFLFEEMRESLRMRIVINSTWFILANACAAWLLWSTTPSRVAQFQRLVAAVLFSYATFLFARMMLAIVVSDLSEWFAFGPVQIMGFLSAMVFQFLLPMALVVMLFRAKQGELEQLSRRDPLTGMGNRLALTDTAKRWLRDDSELQGRLALVVFDLDHFKTINDVYGHQAGDDVLQAVARRIARESRQIDRAFRIGGEEFLVLLPGAGLEQAAQVAERYRAALAATPEPYRGGVIEINASFGVVQWRGGDEGWDDLLRRADRALYQAKCGGRNKVVVVAH
ncbi:MAG: diguanylate cyclase [Wenzhouxiangella sp.]